ncbi:MAG: IS3 family transposase [Lachnospiraceae bacterium]|nr:IS3 family transposase [Lachnospiraceae bacterium]
MFKKIECLNSRAGKVGERDKVAVITELRQEFKLTALLEYVGMPRSTYYYYLRKSKERDKYASIKDEINSIYHENQGRYGYRRITMELRNRGYRINHKTVQRLMTVLKLKCMVRIKKYRSYKGEIGKVAPNLIQRDFTATAPNQKWTTDITEFSLFGTKIYLSPILDILNFFSKNLIAEDSEFSSFPLHPHILAKSIVRSENHLSVISPSGDSPGLPTKNISITPQIAPELAANA